MNKRIKTKWLKVLRSGNYKQGMTVLHSAGKRGGNYKFCCLGVLCDIYLKEKKLKWKEFPTVSLEKSSLHLIQNQKLKYYPILLDDGLD